MTKTEYLSASDKGIARAATLLRSGGLVAFATETVYGLGADAGDDRAVARIYEAKGRPSFNPLIVHLADTAQARDLVEWPDLAQKTAQAFWPGPLTLVLPLRKGAPISKLVTAGLDTLAIRIPANKSARAFLRAADRPVAAPSANLSGQISPTCAGHVRAGLGGRIEAVLDAGPCEMGLESTIIGFTGVPTLLRPGGVTPEALQEVLQVSVPLRKDTDKISAPGQTLSHYAPRARVRLDAHGFAKGEARLGFGAVDCDLNLSASGDLREAAANLFAHLHRLDAMGADVIAISPIPQTGLGLAINDRLKRAAAER